jgi:hypothetical protein
MDLFKKRMNMSTKENTLGLKLADDSATFEDITFTNNRNVRKGNIYDWDLNKLESVYFRHEKVKTHTAEGKEVEYYIHFKPSYNPEHIFRDEYFIKDGRERIGFYVDVYDWERDTNDKWLIVGKDERLTADRYNAFKCNWEFEWVQDGIYHTALGVLRTASDTSFSNVTTDSLGGSSVKGEIAMFLPTNEEVSKIQLGQCFMVNDSIFRPQVYEVVKIKDTIPFGVTKFYLKEKLFNQHKDFCGIVNEAKNVQFVFPTPISDLQYIPNGSYHRICNCIKESTFDYEKPLRGKAGLICDTKKIYVLGQSVVIEVKSDENANDYSWDISIDGENYDIEELINDKLFEINVNEDKMTIRCINKDLIGYEVIISISDDEETYYDQVMLEVCA